MNKNEALLFFRNDDVRNVLDESLINLTELCLRNKVPISHAVEPANVSMEVIKWLIDQKKLHPELIEIIQHGYNHNLLNPNLKMEFGGSRGFEDQLNDLIKGKDLMDQHFGKLWSPIFSFPYGTYNQHTLKAINKLGYHAISSKISFSFTVRIKNLVGKFLKIETILGKKVNYHPKKRNSYNFKEISVSVNLIKGYKNYSIADHYSLDEIKNQINSATKHTHIIGVLFHHRFHSDQMELIEELIGFLKKKGVKFSTIADIVQ